MIRHPFFVVLVDEDGHDHGIQSEGENVGAAIRKAWEMFCEDRAETSAEAPSPDGCEVSRVYPGRVGFDATAGIRRLSVAHGVTLTDQPFEMPRGVARVWVVMGEHPTTPGLLLSTHASEEAATARAVKLLGMILDDTDDDAKEDLEPLTTENWRETLEAVQALWEPMLPCNVEITECEVQP